jgi:hypothetical protein
VPAKEIKFDLGRRDPHRTYGLPATHRQAVIPLARKTATRRRIDAETRRSRTINSGLLLLTLLLAVALCALIWRIGQQPTTPRYRPTPVLKTLPTHVRGVISF